MAEGNQSITDQGLPANHNLERIMAEGNQSITDQGLPANHNLCIQPMCQLWYAAV